MARVKEASGRKEAVVNDESEKKRTTRIMGFSTPFILRFDGFGWSGFHRSTCTRPLKVEVYQVDSSAT